MQAWSLSRHVHDPACRLSFAGADAAAGMRPNTVCWPQMGPAKTWSAAVSAAWARRAKGKGKHGKDLRRIGLGVSVASGQARWTSKGRVTVSGGRLVERTIHTSTTKSTTSRLTTSETALASALHYIQVRARPASTGE